MIRRGELDAINVGKEWRIPEHALDALRTGYGRRRPDPLFMTTDEFLKLPVEKVPVQLIKGLVVRDAAPFVPHQELVGKIHILMHRCIAEAGEGRVLLSPTDVVLSDDTVLQPDLLAVSKKRFSIIGNRVEGPPDLVIEVESENTRERDMTTKRMLYAEFGVPEVWYVSGRHEYIIQMTDPVDGDYRSKQVHEKQDVIVSYVFPTLTVELSKLFAED